MNMPDLIKQALDQARLKLLDLTHRNRLLNYRESARCIAVVDELPREVCNRLFEDKAFRFVPHDGKTTDPPASELPPPAAAGSQIPQRHRDGNLQTPYSTNDLKNRLRKLVNDFRTILEETGASSAYLAIGFLRYRESEDSQEWHRAPLILLPVRIERTLGGWEPSAFTLKYVDEELDTNRSLLHKLESLSVRLPEITDAWISDPSSEDEYFDPEAYLTAVARAIRGKATKDWQVERQMAVGVFRFQKQAMWHDLSPDRWPTTASLTEHSLVRRILLGPQSDSPPPGVLPDIDHTDSRELDGHTESMPLILDADSSQVQALTYALQAEHGLVIEGPPGTGKSQTIANLIAAAIARGKTVLFVAEKLAALEVVSSRLTQKGLDPFCLELHGLNTNRKTFYEKLQKRIDLVRPAAPIALARRRQDLERYRSQMQDWSRLLSTPIGPFELPAHEVVWRIESLRQKLPANLALHELTIANMDRDWFEAHTTLANEYAVEFARIAPESLSAWTGFVPRTYTDEHRAALFSSLSSTINTLDELRAKADSLGLYTALGGSLRVRDILPLRKHTPAHRIPPLPQTTTQEHVQAVLTSGSLSQVRAFLDTCKEFLALRQALSAIIDLESPAITEEVSRALGHVSNIAGICDTPTATLDECEHLAARHSVIRDLLAHVAEKAEVLKEFLTRSPRRLSEYEAYAAEALRLVDAPAFIGVLAYPAHTNTRTRESLTNAHERAQVLVKDISACELLNPDRVDDTGALLGAIDELESHRRSWAPWLSSRYRSARRYLVSRKRPQARITRSAACISALRKLHAVCCARDAFAQNREYQAALGPVFAGVATEWDCAQKLLDHAALLREALGQERARILLSAWDEHATRITDAAEAIQAALRTIAEFRQEHSSYPAAMWHRPLRELSDVLSRHQASLADAATFFREDGGSLTTRLTFQHAKEALGTQFARYRELVYHLNSHKLTQALCGVSNASEVSSPDAAEAAHGWLLTILQSPGMQEAMLPWLLPPEPHLHAERNALLTELGERCYHSLQQLNSELAKRGDVNTPLFFGADADLAAMHDKCAACRTHIDSLPAIQRIGLQRTRLQDAGMQAIPAAVENGTIQGRTAGDWLEFAAHSRAFTEFLQAHPELRMVSNTTYDSVRKGLADADRELFSLTAQEIASATAKNVAPQGNATGAVRTFTELGLLRHQARLERKHLPLRQLMTRAGTALKALKPCFLMSPLSVAQYLPPGKVQFDLVIMDEASQIRPEDAIGAIARGETCVIVGDPHQLPPSRFFDSAGNADGQEEEDQTVIVDTNSILDACLTQLPMRRLTWHYRSEHERLIQFSNHQFYDDELKVFPSPRATSSTHGVRGTFVQAPSYRKGGYNRGEAEVVVQKAIEHLRRSEKRSLGIVAMNKRQAEEIQCLLEAQLRKDTYLQQRVNALDPPLFIKNLENVQGDERDIIIISTTYGPAAPGKAVIQRFGPINSPVGHRRLNVVATRAKQCVEVVSSLRPQDIVITDNPSKGIRVFRDYLTDVFTGAVPDRGVLTDGVPESPFEEAVRYHIRAMGYECESQIGVAGFFVDLGVRHPVRTGDFILGVECDGATYHSSRSARDRDRLRQEILENKGWRIHRIWSTSWFSDRGTELRRLKAAIDDAIADYDSYKSLPPSEASPDASGEATDHEALSTAEIQRLLYDIEQEEEEREESLKEALDRFWTQEIRPLFPDRSNSILNPEMVSLLVDKRPHSVEQFVEAIPAHRYRYEREQQRFLADILEVIREFT